MGFGSKIKSAVSSVSEAVQETVQVVKVVVPAVQTVADKTQDAALTAKEIANNPAIQSSAIIAATALGGPAGAQAVNQAYAVMNAEGNILEKALVAAQAAGVNMPVQYAGQQASSEQSASGGIRYEYEYEQPTDKSGFTSVGYDSNPAASGAGQLTQSFLKKHKTKIIVGDGAVGLFVAYKMLKGKKKKRR